MKKKLELKPGVKYKGYCMLNEFGEIDFTPEQTGSRQGVVKLLKEAEGYSLRYSKERVLIHINIKREKGIKLIQALMQVVNNLIQDFKTYDI